MLNADRTASPGHLREHSYGQNRQLTFVDRFGVWLSARQIRRYAGPLTGKRIGDFGCGYRATFARSILDVLERATLVDLALAEDLKSHPKVTAIEGSLPEALIQIPPNSLDIVLCMSVLEHLWNPLAVLQECFRIVCNDGICLFNVPSWRGKIFLEYSAFRLGLSPKDEMNDHKAYYDVKDFWPLLVRAGFLPVNIRCFSHKFGLNTFAICRVGKKSDI